MYSEEELSDQGGQVDETETDTTLAYKAIAVSQFGIDKLLDDVGISNKTASILTKLSCRWMESILQS